MILARKVNERPSSRTTSWHQMPQDPRVGFESCSLLLQSPNGAIVDWLEAAFPTGRSELLASGRTSKCCAWSSCDAAGVGHLLKIIAGEERGD